MRRKLTPKTLLVFKGQRFGVPGRPYIVDLTDAEAERLRKRGHKVDDDTEVKPVVGEPERLKSAEGSPGPMLPEEPEGGWTEDTLDPYTVPILKQMLERDGRDSSGKRADLVERLVLGDEE